MLRPSSPYDKAGEGVLMKTPKLSNQFEDDYILQSWLQRKLPSSVYNSIEPDLQNLGEKVISNYLQLANEQERYPPQLEKYNVYGHKINKLITCSAWKQQHEIAAKEGMVALGYASNEFSAKIHPKYWRIYQFSKLLLWAPSSGMVSCPIAMTDGAAKLLSIILNDTGMHHIKNQNICATDKRTLQNAYSHLTSFEPHSFWTSGQWMTERGGGSDVTQNGTNTIAKEQNLQNTAYRLFGYKWFSSATDAKISIALARIEGCDENSVQSGNRGVSCFYVPEIENNNIEIIRLKKKLGTRQLPTAEIELKGAKGILLSEKGKGIQLIMMMANITRIHNAMSCCGSMKRTLSLIRAYANERIINGKKLSENALHLRTMATLDILYRSCLYFSMECVECLGLAEHAISENERIRNELLLRLLTPLCKLYTAKCAVVCASEGIECMGGIGYLEASNMPRILRDAQVLTVWEGTTNVLSLDVLRVLNDAKYGKQTLNLYFGRIEGVISLNEGKNEKLSEQFEILKRFWLRFGKNGKLCRLYARDIAYSLCRIYCAALLYEHANFTEREIDFVVYQKMINENDSGLMSPSLLNLMNNDDLTKHNQYENAMKCTKHLGMGVCSKL